VRPLRIILAVLTVTAVAATGVASPAAAAPRQDRDIVQTAVAAGNFTTLTKLLKRAGLQHALKQPGPYTVFAPTDAAFAKVPKKQLNGLLRSKAKLKAVLLYHVLGKKLTAADVVKRSSAKTLSGKKIRFRVEGSNVFVNRARVTKPDVMASNGVIHAINHVLIAPGQ
jgi:uncharacterized surface protein with fasciclin (FAS1) repeats